MDNLLHFILFETEHSKEFKALNIEWLESFFVVEPYDELVLSNPIDQIITPGGFIFMASLNGEIIGTFAFIKKEEGVYEFSKMAVTPKQRGKGFGNQIVRFVIRFAEQHHWEKLILYSSTKLENSIHLYRKYGFIEVPIDPDIKYARGNIKMEIRF
ncbi:GNAT family N-acetyltransferase [Flavobacteriaceae bacterium]|nr:GNAT family N-acetyltransferase [Flavobacteriaceae bacterium]MDC1056566.1 GNAT family N-acetyltransferase [Flavobacteriaceae bacterium]